MNYNVSFKMRKSYYGMGHQDNKVDPKIEELREKDRQNGVYRKYPKYPGKLFKDEQHRDSFTSEVKKQSSQEAVEKSDIIVEDVDVQNVYESIKNKDKEESFEEYKMYEGRNFSKPLAFILAASTMAYTGAGIVYVSNNKEANEPEIVIVETVDSPTSLLMAAGEHDIKDIGMLLSYNEIDDISHIKEPMSIKIPNKYDVVSHKLEKLEEDLAKGGNNDYQTAKLQVQIADLKAKKERQDELAFAYKDGDYVHFYMKDYTLATELEKAFDIKHGKLEKVGSDNNIYEYYDNPALSQHQIYRAKLKDIKK